MQPLIWSPSARLVPNRSRLLPEPRIPPPLFVMHQIVAESAAANLTGWPMLLLVPRRPVVPVARRGAAIYCESFPWRVLGERPCSWGSRDSGSGRKTSCIRWPEGLSARGRFDLGDGPAHVDRRCRSECSPGRGIIYSCQPGNCGSAQRERECFGLLWLLRRAIA